MAGSVSNWLTAFQAGDREAAQHLWNRYYQRLVQASRSRLPPRQSRISDEEDVAVCAFHSFFRGIEAGRFPQVCDRDNLWHLLLFIAARKIQQVIRHERRQKRMVPNVTLGCSGNSADLAQLVGDEPSPALAFQTEESLRTLLLSLGDGQLANLAILRLEGFSNVEIAERLGCSLSTVERKLRRIRHEWSRRADL